MDDRREDKYDVLHARIEALHVDVLSRALENASLKERLGVSERTVLRLSSELLGVKSMLNTRSAVELAVQKIHFEGFEDIAESLKRHKVGTGLETIVTHLLTKDPIILKRMESICADEILYPEQVQNQAKHLYSRLCKDVHAIDSDGIAEGAGEGDQGGYFREDHLRRPAL